MLRLLKPAALFVVGLALVGVASLALQAWSIARNSHHMESREAHIPHGATEMSLGASDNGN